MHSARTIVSSCSSLLVVALATSGLAQESSSPGGFTRNVALQVEREPDYSASDLSRLLADDAYLGAVAPNLITLPGLKALPSSYIPAGGLITVVTNLGSAEILTLSFNGQNPQTVNESADKLLKHLQSLVPTRRRQAQELLLRGQDLLKSMKDQRDAAAAALSDFERQYGADVDQQLRELQERMRRFRQDLADIDEKQAMASATRDYLRKAADAAAAKGTPLKGGDAELGEIRKQVDLARHELDDLLKQYSADHPKVVTMKETLKRLESQLAGVDASGGGPTRASLEMRLFESEEEVFQLEHRKNWLVAQLADLEKSQGPAIELAARRRVLEEALQLGRSRFDEARASVTMQERNAAAETEGPWIHVLAGG